MVEEGESLVGDGDELTRSVEHLETLRGGRGAEGGGAEVAALADLAFSEGIDGIGGDLRKELGAGEEEAGELICLGFELGEGVGLGEIEVAAARAAQSRNVGAAAEGLAEVVSEGADVGAGGAVDVELERSGGERDEGKREDHDVDGLEVDGLVLAGELVGGDAVDFLGGDGGRELGLGTGEAAEQGGDVVGGEVDGLGGGEGFAFGIVGGGGEAEEDGGAVGLAVAGVELGEARGAADDEGEDAGGEGVEGAEMADLASAGEAADAVDGVV